MPVALLTGIPPGAEEEQPAPRIPPDDESSFERGKRFFISNPYWAPPVAVSVEEGEVADLYAPGDLVAKLGDRVSTLLKALGGGWVPMFYGAAPTHSMTLFFGDPRPVGEQRTLPVENVLAQAQLVAELIDLDGDELYQRALRIGPPAEKYAELAALIQSEGVTMRWEVRGERPRRLTSDRAFHHHDTLTAEVPKIDRPITVNGVLYRVIAEPRGDHLGSVGIRLHSWSPPPPGYKKGGRVLAVYEKPEIEEQIRDGLFDESVEARLLVRTPVPGSTFDPARRDLIVDNLASGPSEQDRLGPRLIEDEDLGE